MSHLLQMRGLKLKYIDIIDYNNEVASFTDAWIETFIQPASTTTMIGRIFYRCVD